MPAWFDQYRKFIVAALAGVGVILNETAGGGSIRWIDVVLAVLAALGVVLVPNAQSGSAPAAPAAPVNPSPVPPPAA